MKKILLPFCFIISFVLHSFSQEYPIKWLDIAMGLSNNSVNSIYQDKYGYMWFGTYDGLNRYDGYHFKIFRNEIGNKKSLAANYIFCVQGDSKNNIWVGGTNGGSVYNPLENSFSRLSLSSNKELIQDGISQIKEVNDSLMIAGCSKSGLVAFKSGSFTGMPINLFYLGKRIVNYDVTAIEPVPSKGFCWVFIKKFGLYKLWINKLSLQAVASGKKQANVIRQDKAGIFWLGTDEGLFTLDLPRLQFSQNLLPYKSIVTTIMADRANDIYVATDGSGVFKMDKNKSAVPFKGNSDYPLLKSDAVWDLFEDKDGNKWFGTLRGGISMIGNSQRNFKHIISKNDNPSANYTLSFCEDKNKKVWIGTDGAGIRIWDRKNNTFSKLTKTEGLSSNFVPGITCDYTNTLWVATWYGGINRIDPDTHQIKHYNLFNPKAKKEEKNVWFVFEDQQRMLWAASTREGMLYLYNRKADKFELYNSQLSDLLCMAQDHNGILWTGNYTHLYGINKKTNTFTSQKIGYPIRCILEDKDSILWIGTSEGGLLQYNPQKGTYKRYSVKNGLAGNTILRLLLDKSGNLWASTYNGLSRFDTKRNVFRNFSVSDGLQSSQFSYNAGLELSTGEFIFGGINGFNLFSPDSIKNTGHGSTLLLSDISVNNTSIKGKQNYYENQTGHLQTISLPFDQTTLSLDYVALDYENADKINYAYRLEGWDEQWNLVGKNLKANYARLPEGTYIFKVKTTNNYGEWGKESALLIIHVLPPWYRTWWAYLLYVIGVAWVVIGYIRYNKYKERMRYEVKLAHMENLKEKELSEKQVSMFTYISHEFRTPLSLIINPIKNVIKQQNEKGDPIPDLGVAHRNARRLLSLIDQLLLFRRAENGADELSLSSVNLNLLCDEVYQCFTQQSKEQNIRYELELPEQAVHIIGDYEKIEISLFNLASNAFKYTPVGGSIKISLRETASEVFVEINDTGCGIREGEKEHIFEKFRQVNLNTNPGRGFGIGLFIVKYFVEKHKGTVTCESQEENGSKFTLGFQKGYDHFADMPISATAVRMSELVKELVGENLYENEISETDSFVPEFDNKDLQNQIISKKKSILIIDDNTEIRNYLIHLFNSLYIVYSANNGLDGLTLAKKYLPDVILSDIAMEGLTGLELCKKIKESDSMNHILVILLTASTNQETHLQGISDGADDYITKPFDNEILKAKVETLIRNRMQLRNYFLENITLREHDHKVPSEYRDFLKKCIEIIEQNLNNEHFTIKLFSQAMGMSHSGLYTKVKAISGQTLNGFIRSVRIRRAAVLMLTGDIQVAQAASQVGFEDRKHFREQFVKLFGMTPSEYIKKYRHSFNKELNVIQK